jgi:hypothetical protein
MARHKLWIAQTWSQDEKSDIWFWEFNHGKSSFTGFRFRTAMDGKGKKIPIWREVKEERGDGYWGQ